MASDPTARGARKAVRIGKYEVVAHIATGGMGAVYKARDTETGRDVALKVLTPEAAAKPAMVERFRREARSAAKLSHENIVALYEFGENAGTYFLAMEFIEGIDLHEYVERKGPLPPTEALSIVVQACRALDHAHERAIVHRDIKPSNFLIVTRPGKPLVKLTDMGLARETAVEEFRVTRAGTTVGTLDFISPEQARDSGTADIRSDLYSLGGTWHFLLAGQAPFPRGGLGERLLKIMSEKPPDVRTFNPRVSAGTAAVIHRLLAKEPADRYQTPRELLDDLHRLERGEAPQATDVLPLDEAPPAVAPSKKSDPQAPRRSKRPSSTTVAARTDAEAAPAKGKRPRRAGSVSDRRGRKRKASRRVWWYAGAAAGVLLLIGIGLALALRAHRHPKTEDAPLADATGAPDGVPPSGGSGPEDRPQAERQPVGAGVPPSGGSGPEDRLKAELQPQPPPAEKAKWRRLYEPDKPIQPAELRKEMEAPWAKAAPAAGEPAVLKVGRGTAHSSLASALAAAPPGRPCVLEVRDNGPFFDVSTAVAGRALTIRAARGYRPLLVWDMTRTLDERRRARATDEAQPLAFLDLRGGGLSLENVDLVLAWPETAPPGKAVLLRVQDGDLNASGCTFSVAGGPPGGMTLARFASARPEPARCRFTRCFVRGAMLSALDLDAPGAEVLFDGCLVAGGEPPLIQVRATNDNPPTLRVVRSTLVAGRTFLRVEPARPIDRNPALNWFGWDALVCRSGARAGGDLVSLPAEVGPDKMTWRAVNCLYAGWQNLLTGSTPFPATAIAPWRRQWDRIEGDDAVPGPWPAAALLAGTLAELPAAAFRITPDLPVGAAGTAAPDQPLGCAFEELPPGRDNWLSLASDPFVPAVATQPEDPAAPEIPTLRDGRYHGGPVDLGRTDLGGFLKQMERQYGLGPRVVLHLYGTEERTTTPVHLSGRSLVLYFAPPAKDNRPKDAKPLVLTPAEGARGEALIEVENGNLELIGGTLRLPDDRGPGWLLAVRGGELRLSGTRLEGPEGKLGSAFRGLVHFRGSGETAADRLRSCLIQKSVLVSGKDGIVLEGLGAGLRLRQSLLVTGGAGVRLAPGEAFKGRANVQCVLDHATVAARDAVLRLGDCPTPGPPAEPVWVQTRNCAFLSPFTGRTAKPGLLLYEGDALGHGLLMWQGENDCVDRRLHFAAAAAGPSSSPLPPGREGAGVRGQPVLAAWLHLWGTPNVRHPGPEVNFHRTLDTFPWPLERLILPAALASYGADLDALGILKKPAEPAPGR
jgi:serine/threonine protein kinase